MCAIRDLAPELAALFTLPTVNTPLCSGGITAFILQRVHSKEILWVPFCFALLSIYNLTSQLQSKLCLFYLDNGTLGEATKHVLSDAEELGLTLNHSKYEVKTQLPGMSYCLPFPISRLLTQPLPHPWVHQLAVTATVLHRRQTPRRSWLVGRIHYLHTLDALFSNSKAAVHPLNSSLFPF